MEFKLTRSVAAGNRAKLVAVLLMCAGFVVHTAGQELDLFDTRAVERSIKHQYRLTTQEIKTLRPILKRQNAELVMVLARCMDEEQPGYLCVWTQIVTMRDDFESIAVKRMERRHAQVIRAARRKLEHRIVDEWRSFYLEGLGSYLELDRFQVGMLDIIFVNDQEERFRIIDIADRRKFEGLWQKLSDNLEKQLEGVLSTDQLRDYRKLDRDGEQLIA